MESLLGQLKKECERLKLFAGNKNVESRRLKNIQGLVVQITGKATKEYQEDGAFMPGELNYVKKETVENPVRE